jgi:serine/threonine protein kinase
MECMSDGSVAQRFNRRKVPEKVVASIVKQICDGLKYMHIENIIHRDIKPDNVFIHEVIIYLCKDYIKLGDFGCSVFSDSKRNTMVGSLAYFSPEQLNNESYDEKIDIWSVGILCYELLTGRSPFEEEIMKITRREK